MAEGGQDVIEKPQETAPVDEEEDEMESLMTRLRGLGSGERRKTIDRLLMLEEQSKSEFLHSDKTKPKSPILPQSSQDSKSSTIVVDTTPRKIKNFSGHDKIGSGEVDYKHWRRSAVRIVEDKELSESKKRLILLQSLAGIAEDAIDLHRESSPRYLIDVLDKIFGSTADGYDMLADFYQMVQENGQSASQYLNKLYIRLTEIVDRDGLTHRALPECLLRQFVRGCSDEDLIVKLRLEDIISRPPEFPDLMERIRREEARRTERKLRLKRAKVNSCFTVVDEPKIEQQNEAEKLRQRIKELEAEKVVAESLAQRVNRLEESNKKDSRFCFRCGEDGHMAYDCVAVANKTLVEEKQQARRRNRQGNWRRLPQTAAARNNSQ